MKGEDFIPTDSEAAKTGAAGGAWKNWLLAGAAVVIIIVAPVLLASHEYVLSVLNFSGIYAIVLLGLYILTGYCGMLSLGHGAFFGLGAYSSAIITLKYGLPAELGLAVGIIVTGVIAFCIGLPTTKLTFFHLALVTMGMCVIINILFEEQVWLTGGSMGLKSIPALSLAGFKISTTANYFRLVWLVLLPLALFTRNLADSNLGRAFRAIKEDEVAARSSGINTARVKNLAFVMSAVYAAIGGSIYAHYVGFIDPHGFGLISSFNLITMIFIGGDMSILGPILGGLLFQALPMVLNVVQEYSILIMGVILLVVILFMPRGLAGGVETLFKWVIQIPRRQERPRMLDFPVAVPLNNPHPAPAMNRVFFEVQNLSKSFGGLQAVNNVAFKVNEGELVAVIGPNGAGKSTLLHLISGLLSVSSGTIHYDGKDITKMSAHDIAAMGMARTFQNIRLYRSMTVLENVMVGCHLRGNMNFFHHGLKTPRDKRTELKLRQEALEALRLLKLESEAWLPADTLTYGEQKLLEVSRALVSRPKLLLLDEPVAGLNEPEVREFEETLDTIRNKNLSIVLVEHNMDFIMKNAGRVIVLYYGEKLAEGTPEEIQRNAAVISAYLGEGSY
ncbi:MAG: branched-chain amino acid ABC transporter ATP-binding protein/permease [Pseudomonadota bacterium]